MFYTGHVAGYCQNAQIRFHIQFINFVFILVTILVNHVWKYFYTEIFLYRNLALLHCFVVEQYSNNCSGSPYQPIKIENNFHFLCL